MELRLGAITSWWVYVSPFVSIAGKAPLSLRYAKQALNAAIEESVGDTISNEAKLQHICITSEDAQEGVVAFMQKRAPIWKGR